MDEQSPMRETWTDNQYADFVRDAYQYLNAAQDAAKQDFAIGTYQRYDWDQSKGTLVFSNQGVPKVVVDVQFVGSFSKQTNTWLWSWDNATLLPSVKDKILEVRKFGERHGLSELTTAKWKATEEDGWAMTAVAAKILQAKGAYRSPDGNGCTFLIFTDIRWARNN